MPAARDRTTQAARPATPTPETRALRARLVADAGSAAAAAAHARLGAICAGAAAQLHGNGIAPQVLATIDRTRRPGAVQAAETATWHGSVWVIGGSYLTASAPCLLDGPPPSPATATAEGLSVTRYATALLYPWQQRPADVGDQPSPALVLDAAPTPVWVRGVLHTMPAGDVERDAIGAGTWYVRDADTTIALRDTGNGLALRDLEHDLAREVVAMTAWWNR